MLGCFLPWIGLAFWGTNRILASISGIGAANLRACVLRRGGCSSGRPPSFITLMMSDFTAPLLADVKYVNYIRMVWMSERCMTENELKWCIKD